jgi:hypothetical protein
VADYNFTTSTDRPVIRARINNGLYWNTFVFDFTDESNYVEHQSLQSVDCITEERNNGTGRMYNTVMMPTLTVSLERLSWYGSSSSSMAGSFFALAALVSTAFLLLL